MDNKYFSKFPVINYNNEQAINIMRRVGISDNIKNFLNIFYQYTAEKDDTVDSIAYNYYNDVDYDWLIYLANDIVDPYYDAWLSDDVFKEYIVKKYGSIRKAQRKIIYYKNNFDNDASVLSVAGYAALTEGLKKYWHPIDNTVNIIGYERAQVEYKYSTNKIISYDYVSASNTFSKDEIVYIDSDSSQYATVSWANNTSVVLRHIEGNFSTSTNFTLTGENSNIVASVNATSYANFIDFTDSNNIVVQNVIPDNEAIYFSKVTAYDEELEFNEKKRELYLVDERNKAMLNKQLRELMR